jgi:hypothetical protein
LEVSVIVEIDDVLVVPRKVVDRFGVRGFVEGDSSAQTLRERGSEGFEDRSDVVEAKRSLRLLLRRQMGGFLVGAIPQDGYSRIG